jgi:dihydroflavonol-4-reductase
MKIFITGATGFIGSHLIRRLDQTEHQLYCLIRKSSQARQIERLGGTAIMGDLTDRDSLLKGMASCNWIINLANIYSFWEPDKRIFYDVNVKGNRNIMECALESGVSKVIHVSTAGIYGKPSDNPFIETSPVGPERFSEYFRTKYEGDCIAWDLYKTKNLPLVVIYPTAVLGSCDPKATGQYIRRLITKQVPAQAFVDKTFTFVHVKDVAEAILRAAEKADNIGEKYIIGKYRLTFGEINKIVSEVSGVPLPFIKLPDFMAILNGRILTLLADLIKKPPLWGMAIDQMRVMKAGVAADGVKAENELGISYTPIRTAIEDAIASYSRVGEN